MGRSNEDKVARSFFTHDRDTHITPAAACLWFRVETFSFTGCCVFCSPPAECGELWRGCSVATTFLKVERGAGLLHFSLHHQVWIIWPLPTDPLPVLGDSLTDLPFQSESRVVCGVDILLYARGWCCPSSVIGQIRCAIEDCLSAERLWRSFVCALFFL